MRNLIKARRAASNNADPEFFGFMTGKAATRLFLIPALFLSLAACLTGSCLAEPGSGQGEPLRVFVSVLPQKTFVEKIGKDHVDVRAMVRPGHNPHTYDPTPQQIAALSEATLYIRTGVPFEHAWMERIRSGNPEMQVLDAREGIELVDMEDHDHADLPQGEHDGKNGHVGHQTGAGYEVERQEIGQSDPHVWTDPHLVKYMTGRIRDKLAELDPGNEQHYRRNYAAFAAELDALDRDIRLLLRDVANRKFMVFHPAWGYFARAYGLIQVPIENEGKEPGPRAMAALIEQARREQVKVIFVQPHFSSKSAEQVAQAIGGCVVAIDPLSADYADNLRKVAGQIAKAGNSPHCARLGARSLPPPIIQGTRKQDQ